MPDNKTVTPLSILGDVCARWIGAGGGVAGKTAQADFMKFRNALSKPEYTQFEVLLKASQFWANGTLEINSLSDTEIDAIRMLETKLFRLSRAEGMASELFSALRNVRQDWEQQQGSNRFRKPAGTGKAL